MTVRVRRYRKLPVEVEAVEFTDERGTGSAASIVRWILDNGGRACYETTGMDTVHGMISIATLEGRMYATPGDFIIRGVQGEFYPRKPDIFNLTYEAVDEPECVRINSTNRMILHRAYDDGNGGNISLRNSVIPGYFDGEYDGEYVMEGVEINGVLFSIVPNSGGGTYAVLVGTEIVENEAGVTFNSVLEARAYIQGLTAK